MKQLKEYKFWFITGSQHLYGEETLKKVAEHSAVMVKKLNEAGILPVTIEFKLVATTSDAIEQVMEDANYDQSCAGIITWMHTFSPSKMWIGGLKILHKPLLQK